MDSWALSCTVLMADEFFFLKNQRLLSYSHSRQPDLPVTQFTPFSAWLILLFFFHPPLKPHCQDRVIGFVSGGGNIAVAIVLSQYNTMCIALRTYNSLWNFSILFFMLA